MTELKPIQYIILKHLLKGSKSRTRIFKEIIISIDEKIAISTIYKLMPDLIKKGYIKIIPSPKFGEKKNQIYYRITKKGKYKSRLKYLEDHIEYYDDVKILTMGL